MADNLVIIWDGLNKVDIRFPVQKFKGLTKGLCGNFNDNSADELTDYSGKHQPDINKFADSYNDDREKCQNDQYTEPACFLQCTEFDGPEFTPCHSVVDKEFFKALCKKDKCAYPGSDSASEANRRAVVCAMLDVYSRQCALNNVTLNWRRQDFCRKYH